MTRRLIVWIFVLAIVATMLGGASVIVTRNPGTQMLAAPTSVLH
jgi:hypothetical protein